MKHTIAEESSPPRCVLKIDGLGKKFPGVVALDGVDFAVGEGEIHALLGANGAGKSTLIKVVAGLYRRDAGEIYIDSLPVTFAGPAEAYAAGIRVIYQDFSLAPDLTVAENIFLGKEIKTSWGAVDLTSTRTHAVQLMEMVGATFAPNVAVRDLSVGQRQLVEIAKALNGDARILILDEPTAALSQGESENLFLLIRRLAAKGVGIIYVSHRLDEIAPLAQKVTVLRDGFSVGTYASKTLTRKKLIALITGQEHKSSHPEARDNQHGECLLEVNNLDCTGHFKGISFNVNRGEILVLTGLVGAGRTEIMEVLFGIRRHSAGTVRLNGKKFMCRSPREAISAGIALIPEDRREQGLALALPVFENIALSKLGLFISWFGLSKRARIDHAEQQSKHLNIRTSHPRVATKTLSGGNQQKVVLAKWLTTDAQIFLFDEPTQGVDVGAKKEIYTLINKLVSQGRAVLVVSSDLEEVLTLADRVLTLRAGRIVAEFAKETMSASQIIEAITHGETR